MLCSVFQRCPTLQFRTVLQGSLFNQKGSNLLTLLKAIRSVLQTVVSPVHSSVIPSPLSPHLTQGRDNVSLIHATLSSRRRIGIRIPPPPLSPPPLIHPHPLQISSKHDKSLRSNLSLDSDLRQLFHHVPTLRQNIMSKSHPGRHVPQFEMCNPGVPCNLRTPCHRVMGFYESVYPVGIDYVSEIGYVAEMACCDECCVLGSSIGVCGGGYCHEGRGVFVWSSLWADAQLAASIVLYTYSGESRMRFQRLMVDREYSGVPCRGVAFDKIVSSIAYCG